MTGGNGGGGKGILIVLLILFGFMGLCCAGAWFGREALVKVLQADVVGLTPGSGVAAVEARDLAPFSRVEVVGSTDVQVTVGIEQSVVVEGDDNLLPMIETTVVDGELVVSTDGSYSTTVGVLVRITVPALAGVSVVGTGDVSVIGVEADVCDVRIVGSGDVDVVGSTDRLNVHVNGSGDAELFELKSRDATVTVTGSGDVDLFVTESLDAKVSGTGDITYDGDPPSVIQTVNGVGDIEPRN